MAKKRVRKEVNLEVEIKKMEDAKRKTSPIKEGEQGNVVSYNSWHHQRKHLIPKQHIKEVIWADMVARGIKEMATMKEFDEALRLYGVKL